MPTFRFEAMDSSGVEVTDILEAENERAAKHRLVQRGLFVTNLTVASAGLEPQPRSELGETVPAVSGRQTSLTPALSECHSRERRAIGFGFAVMGSLCVIFGIWMASDAIPFVFSAASASGLCVGQAYDSSDNEYNVPIIEFTVEGKKHRVESRGIFGMRFISGYRRGHRMTVLYPPGRPEEARVGGRLCNLQFPSAFVGMGGLFVLSGVWLVKASRRPNKAVNPSGGSGGL
jgi:hypothetical protein